MNIKLYIKGLLSVPVCFRWRIKEHGKCCYIGLRSKIVKKNARLKLGNNVNIMPDCLIYCSPKSEMILGSGVEIGQFSRVATRNYVEIGENVITGPNVFIADYNHNYDKVGTPIKLQGNNCNGNEVIIGDGAWIGTNCVIVGNVTIGKGTVIGANSVVTKDIPDYCVAVGNPCKVIKKYDKHLNKWIKT